jgi:hypothetical protein
MGRVMRGDWARAPGLTVNPSTITLGFELPKPRAFSIINFKKDIADPLGFCFELSDDSFERPTTAEASN